MSWPRALSLGLCGFCTVCFQLLLRLSLLVAARAGLRRIRDQHIWWLRMSLVEVAIRWAKDIVEGLVVGFVAGVVTIQILVPRRHDWQRQNASRLGFGGHHHHELEYVDEFAIQDRTITI